MEGQPDHPQSALTICQFDPGSGPNTMFRRGGQICDYSFCVSATFSDLVAFAAGIQRRRECILSEHSRSDTFET
jgi:hypothetical protein